jgi:hypothetical protein
MEPLYDFARMAFEFAMLCVSVLAAHRAARSRRRARQSEKAAYRHAARAEGHANGCAGDSGDMLGGVPGGLDVIPFTRHSPQLWQTRIDVNTDYDTTNDGTN